MPRWLVLAASTLLLALGASCDDGGDGDADGDLDGDSDVDVDTDADTDDDASSDADSHADSDTVTDGDGELDADLDADFVIEDVPFDHVVVDADGPVDPWQKIVGDVDGDGDLDLVVGGRTSGGLVYYASPTWDRTVIAPGGGHSTDGEIADVDGDGDLDVVSLTTDELRWYEAPSWAAHQIERRGLHDVEVADLDGDGDVDVVARDQAEFGHSGDELHFYRQDSPSSWAHRAVPCPNGEGLVVADLDGDGDPDVIVNGSWLERSGDIVDGAWAEHPYTTSWTHRNAFIAVGDLDGDGRPDIVLSPSELAGGTYRLSWLEAPADPTAADWTEHVVEDGLETVHHFVGVADLNRDGRLDIATAEMHQGEDPDEVRIYLNEGGGLSFWRQVIAESGSHSMRLADVDGDGDVDLFGANWQGHVVDLWVNLIVD